MNLLPPSAFQSVKKCVDPWKDIVRLSEEVSKLQVENTKLRETQCKPNEQRPISPLPQNCVQQLPTEICQYLTKKDFKYIDELINKQSCEITDLKNEIRSLRFHHKEEITEMERQLTIKEREYGHKITSLEAELKTAIDRYENQVDRLNREHQREMDDCSNVVDRLQSDLANVRIMSGQKVAELEDKYHQMKCSTNDRIDALLLEIKSRDVTIENQSKQMSQLKKYFGVTENGPVSSEISKKEQNSAMAKLKVCEGERENLNHTVQLLNIRLNSLNEILKLQELELSKPSLDIDKSTAGAGVLITRWREKVFALMVQQKSTEISLKTDENNWKTKICDLETKLSTAKNQIEQLTHSLYDRDAQLNLEQITNRNLQGELSEAQQLALCLDEKLQETVHGAELLKEFSSSVWTKFQENSDILNRAMTSCKSYGQRISFACGRLEMLQGLFARREALLKMQIEKDNIAGKNVPEGNRDEGEGGTMYLTNELERVTRERDNLAAQIKQDSFTWESKFASIRGEVQDELETFKQTCGDLESIVQDKVKVCIELAEKLDISQNDLKFSNQTVEDLKVTLVKQEMNLEKLLEEQRDEVENQFADRLADMDRQLSDAKCQQAKAVVSLRQLERQTAREKERSLQHFTTVEEHYKHQIQSLRQQLQALEKERNLMMAILRQEGLIMKLKQERLSPIMVGLEEDEMPVRDNVETEQEPETTTVQTELPQEPGESLANVLEDLKLLTDAVLNDNDSDTESD